MSIGDWMRWHQCAKCKRETWHPAGSVGWRCHYCGHVDGSSEPERFHSAPPVYDPPRSDDSLPSFDSPLVVAGIVETVIDAVTSGDPVVDSSDTSSTFDGGGGGEGGGGGASGDW